MRVEPSPTQNPPRETDGRHTSSTRSSSERGFRGNRVERRRPTSPTRERTIDLERTNERTNEMAEGLPREEVERMLFFEDARARAEAEHKHCLLYTSPSPRDRTRSRMPSSA